MKPLKHFFTSLLLLLAGTAAAQPEYDLVVVGATPGGIMTAVAAARMGKSSLILERSGDIGGLPANGLGATDIATRGATTGLFTEFIDRVKKQYINKYGADSPQVRDCSDGYHFEPGVAAKIFGEMLAECGERITVLTMRQFDSDPANVEMCGKMIHRIRVTDRTTSKGEWYTGRIFIDATYEGDLGAAAGVPYHIGRESHSEYAEEGAGKIYKYWEGEAGSGSSGAGDNAVQAYNYRLCLTKSPANRTPFRKPANYDREEYISLADDVFTGRNTSHLMQTVTSDMMDANRDRIEKGDTTALPGDVWGIAKLTNMVALPNGKTDANNQHLALISTDLPEENWPWPTASWEWRDRFADRLREYTEGLFWFAATDKSLPKLFRKAVSEWGYAADEYKDNDNFPRQVYVREGRRFEGCYFFTVKDALPTSTGQRPPLHPQSITASHYMLDSHAVLKRETGRIHLDGFLSYPSAPYTVPYGVILPCKVENLLLPVPVSGSHIGFSTLRMEPCWMALGQAAGIAAALAAQNDIPVQQICTEALQTQLIRQHATLVYFKDVSPADADFELAQHMALRGYLTGWNAELDKPADAETIAAWNALSGLQTPLTPGQTRREALTRIRTAGKSQK